MVRCAHPIAAPFAAGSPGTRVVGSDAMEEADDAPGSALPIDAWVEVLEYAETSR